MNKLPKNTLTILINYNWRQKDRYELKFGLELYSIRSYFKM